MSTIRTAAAVACTSALVYVLYLSRPPFDPSGLFSPKMLALTVVAGVAIAASALIVLVRRGDLGPMTGIKGWAGWFPFSGGILLYLLGTYSNFPDVLHWISLWLLIEGVAVLLLGIRIWDLTVPSLSLLLLVAPEFPSPAFPLESLCIAIFCIWSLVTVIFSHSSASWAKPILVAPFVFGPLILLLPAYVPLGALAASAVLGSGSLLLLRRDRGKTPSSCNLDSSPINKGRNGCLNCGRFLTGSSSPHARTEAGVLATVALVTLVAWTAALPVVTVTSNDVNLGTYGVTQITGAPYITVPEGFLQNSSLPSRTLERLYGDQVVVVKHFFPSVRPENFSYTVFLEVSFSHAYLVKHWEYLGGYNRTTEIIERNGSSPVYSTILRSGNGSVVALSYEVPATVLRQGRYVDMYVGVSALAYPSFNLTHQAYEDIKSAMINNFVSPEPQLVQASSWTNDIALSLSTVSVATPFAFLGGDAALIVGVMGVVLKAEKGEQMLLDSVDGLDLKDKSILATAMGLGMRSTPRSGRELLSAYRSRVQASATAPSFFRRMTQLEKMGLLRQEPVLVDGRLAYLWRLTIT